MFVADIARYTVRLKKNDLATTLLLRMRRRTETYSMNGKVNCSFRFQHADDVQLQPQLMDDKR